MLQEHSSAYAWEYTDMKGIDPNVFKQGLSKNG